MTNRTDEAGAGTAAEVFTVRVEADLLAALRMHAEAAGVTPDVWLARVAEHKVRALADAALDEGDLFAPERPCRGLGN